MARAPKSTPPPMHPGEYLRLNVLPTLPATDAPNPRAALAEHLGVPLGQLDRLVKGEIDVSPSLAWRLGIVVGSSPEFWADLQRDYDLWKCRRSPAMAAALAALKPVPKPRARR